MDEYTVDTLREIPLPPYLEEITEFRLLDKVSEKQMRKFYEEIEARNDDLLIMTATETGIARREAILRINPGENESLEVRRARVLLRWYDRVPYTRIVIERKIASLCGAGNYQMDYDPDELVLYLNLSNVEEDVALMVYETLDQLIMLTIILDVKRVVVELEARIIAGVRIAAYITPAIDITNANNSPLRPQKPARMGIRAISYPAINIT